MPTDPVERARKLIAVRRTDEALRMAEQGLAEHPEHLRWLLVKTEAHKRRKEWDRALDAARRVLRIKPDLPYIHYIVGWSLLVLGRPGEALEAGTSALRTKPEYDHGHVVVAMAHAMRYGQRRQEEDAAAARAAMAEAIRISPESADIHNAANLLHKTLGDTEAANASLHTVLALDPHHTGALVELGTQYGRQGKLSRAFSLLESALALAPHKSHLPQRITGLYGAAARKVVAVSAVGACVALLLLVVLYPLPLEAALLLRIPAGLVFAAVAARPVVRMVRVPAATRRFLRGLPGFTVWSTGVLLLPVAALGALVTPGPAAAPFLVLGVLLWVVAFQARTRIVDEQKLRYARTREDRRPRGA